MKRPKITVVLNRKETLKKHIYEFESDEETLDFSDEDDVGKEQDKVPDSTDILTCIGVRKKTNHLPQIDSNVSIPSIKTNFIQSNEQKLPQQQQQLQEPQIKQQQQLQELQIKQQQLQEPQIKQQQQLQELQIKQQQLQKPQINPQRPHKEPQIKPQVQERQIKQQCQKPQINPQRPHKEPQIKPQSKPLQEPQIKQQVQEPQVQEPQIKQQCQKPQINPQNPQIKPPQQLQEIQQQQQIMAEQQHVNKIQQIRKTQTDQLENLSSQEQKDRCFKDREEWIVAQKNQTPADGVVENEKQRFLEVMFGYLKQKTKTTCQQEHSKRKVQHFVYAQILPCAQHVMIVPSARPLSFVDGFSFSFSACRDIIASDLAHTNNNVMQNQCQFCVRNLFSQHASLLAFFTWFRRLNAVTPTNDKTIVLFCEDDETTDILRSCGAKFQAENNQVKNCFEWKTNPYFSFRIWANEEIQKAVFFQSPKRRIAYQYRDGWMKQSHQPRTFIIIGRKWQRIVHWFVKNGYVIFNYEYRFEKAAQRLLTLFSPQQEFTLNMQQNDNMLTFSYDVVAQLARLIRRKIFESRKFQRHQITFPRRINNDETQQLQNAQGFTPDWQTTALIPHFQEFKHKINLSHASCVIVGCDYILDAEHIEILQKNNAKILAWKQTLNDCTIQVDHWITHIDKDLQRIVSC